MGYQIVVYSGMSYASLYSCEEEGCAELQQNDIKELERGVAGQKWSKNVIFSANTAIPIWKQIHGYVITTHLHYLQSLRHLSLTDVPGLGPSRSHSTI